MSKHPSDNTKRNLLRRGLAGILALALILGLLPAAATTAHAASWADSYIQTLVDWGVMRGDVGGNMAPDRSITRAEFVTMMNRAYGYTKLGGHPFTDVRSRDWYNEDIDIAYNIGYFKGTGPTTASPNATLTREQAAVLLSRNMMLQPTVGETLGFSDSRTLSDWSRGLVGAAAANGVIGGYDDGSFQPMRNITRGEVAAMLVRAIGTPVQTGGDHALGNVYGNVTVNTSGVTLRDGVIAGNLYLTGGIDLGDVLLQNVTVLGEIIISGGGESNSSQSSVILRNVVADNLVVDSIGSQFVTIRAEGNTDIPTTVVRTNAYVDDSSLPGYGLSLITLDGEEGALYQLAGNVKEVLNKTPGSSLQVVQGTADKVTVDEYATGSSVLVDGDAVVGSLNLDTAAAVTGTGDIKGLNVGAAGSTVEQLPDKIDIRPGITTDIAGANMNSTQAAESSADPKLLAGYPAVRKIAPNSAELVFRTNKSGTVYWAVSAVADGSVSEADLLDPPVYGSKVLASGKVSATAANTDYTAAVSKLTSGGSYYVTAMLVDGRDQHSPIKVTSFTTPDDTVPAFASGYPRITKNTCEIAQATVMATKSCQLYYALLPAGASAPTPAEFKAAAIPGNLGYGSMSVTKNVTTPFQINDIRLDEKTGYVLYLWLVDHDGAKQSKVVSVKFTTPDETAPIVTSMIQTKCTPNSITLEYTVNEPADLVWAVVTEGNHNAKQFMNFNWEPTNESDDGDSFTLKFNTEAELLAAKVRLMSGVGALKSSSNTKKSPFTVSGLDTKDTKTSSYVIYYIANDGATASGNLSEQIKALRIHTEDNIHPTASLAFTNPDGSEVAIDPNSTATPPTPQADANVRILFSENVKGTTGKSALFLSLYEKVTAAKTDLDKSQGSDAETESQTAYNNARKNLATALQNHITMYRAVPPSKTPEVPVVGTKNADGTDVTHESDGSWVDWNNAEVSMLDDGRLEILLRNVNQVTDPGKAAVRLDGGASYYFQLKGIYDLAVSPNDLVPSPCDLPFSTAFAKVLLTPGDELTIGNILDIGESVTEGTTVLNDAHRIDYHFLAEGQGVEQMNNPNMYWDMLIWADTSMVVTLYSRPMGKGENDWKKMCRLDILVDKNEGYAYKSVKKWITGTANPTPDYELLQTFSDMEYAVHIDQLDGVKDFTSWNQTASIRVSIVAGTNGTLSNHVINGSTQADYNKALGLGALSVGTPDPFTMSKLFTDSKAPEISNGPSIKVHDTGAQIGMTLNRPGQVYYLVIPLSNLRDKDDKEVSDATELTEDRVQTVTTYTPAMDVFEDETSKLVPALAKVPLMTGDPDLTPSSNTDKLTVAMPIREYFINDRTFPEVIKGTTASVPAHTQATIDLSGKLKHNTVYLVCLLSRGVSAVYSDNVYCYRFTTNMPERPILTLQNSGSTTIEATVDRTAPVQSILLIDSGLADHTLKEPFETYVKTGLETDYQKYAATLSDAKDYTVLKAMYDNYAPGAVNSRYPSVFDYFANDTLKNEILQLIETVNTGDLVKAFWGPSTIKVAANAETGKATMKFASNDLREDVDYVCLAVAGSGSVESRAFRSVYPVQVMNDQKPSIQNIGLGLSKPDAVGADGKVRGTIFIEFDQDLYRLVTGYSGRIPVAHYWGDSAIPGDDGFSGLLGCVSFPQSNGVTIPNKEPHSNISTIQLDVEDCTLTTIPISVRGLYNRWGTPITPISIDVKYDAKAGEWIYTTKTAK